MVGIVVVIEFLGLPESPKLVESKLEQALLENLYLIWHATSCEGSEDLQV